LSTLQVLYVLQALVAYAHRIIMYCRQSRFVKIHGEVSAFHVYLGMPKMYKKCKHAIGVMYVW